MKYYVKHSETQAISGPFELDELEAKLKAGELPAGAHARGDFGEGLAPIQNSPPADWAPIESIIGWNGKRPPSSEFPPPPPPPIPPPHPSGIAFCPACGHKLAPNVGSACDRCGKEFVAIIQEPSKPPERSKPEPVLPKLVGGCLTVLIAVLLGFLLAGLLLLHFISSTCHHK